MDDLILLDSIVRPENCTTSVVGALPAPISCVPNITRDLNLTGLRLGLPSTFGWAQGISSEVRLLGFRVQDSGFRVYTPPSPTELLSIPPIELSSILPRDSGCAVEAVSTSH